MNVTEPETKHSKPAQGFIQMTLDSLQKDSAEHESYAGVCKSERIAENNSTDANEQRLLEQILNRKK